MQRYVFVETIWVNVSGPLSPEQGCNLLTIT